MRCTVRSSSSRRAIAFEQMTPSLSGEGVNATLPHVSLAFVLVVAAPPEAGFVAAEWCAVEPLVHAPEAVDSAFVCRVGVVDDAVVERERAHAGPFLPVRREVRSNARCPLGAHGTLLGGPKGDPAGVVAGDSRLPLPLPVRHVQVLAEAAPERRARDEA